MQVKIKLVSGGILPKIKTYGASCVDCYARLNQCDELNDEGELEIKPHETKLIPLGFCVELPIGYEMQIRPRSGLSCKGLVTELGTIDSDYRGEVGAIMNNRSNYPMFIMNGDRICQASVQQSEKVDFLEVEELTDTERGTGGFGSTGTR